MAVQTGRDAVPSSDDEVPGTVRRTVQRIELRSVLRFSILFSVTTALVILLAGGVLYFLGSSVGAVKSVETYIRHAGYPHFRVRTGTVFEVLLALVVFGGVVWTAVTLLAAFVFNLVSEASGGIKVTVRE
ncbi:MAG TPA: DUF3566 domain-containing protein [Actinomycetota bacterium]|nr:DUF3566 domain-containing protein [Actinomycetota bacterium]